MSAAAPSIKFAVQCKASRLYISNFTPNRAAIELTAVERIAHRCESHADAQRMADSLRPLFGSFDFKPVRVEG